MPSPRPSKGQIANVIAAMKAAGISIGRVRVDADGGFEVLAVDEIPVDQDKSIITPSPPQWGRKG